MPYPGMYLRHAQTLLHAARTDFCREPDNALLTEVPQ